MTDTPDFSNFAALAVTEDTTAEFIFTEIVGQQPSLICAPATSENRPYYEAMSREAVKIAEDMQRKPKRRGRRSAEAIQSADEVEEIREKDRKLYSRFCVRSWGTPPRDAKGEEVPFSQENVYGFLKAIPGFMFDAMRGWITNPYNFIPSDALGPDAGEALGESSPRS